MRPQSIVSPEDQKVTFVELFFDLVFVFSVTQVVQLLHDGFDWLAVGQVILVFWLVWWAWTQFTWALNAADTTHPWVELGTLAATAVAFLMAVAIPDVFHGRALWFAVPYVLVRAIGLGLYAWVACENPSQRRAVLTFSVVSIGGLASALLGGITGGSAQYAFWGLTIVLDVVAAAIGGQVEGWDLHPEHFAERYGLFVIIALGESLVVAAGGLAGAEWTGNLLTVALLAVGVTCGFWWTYFTRAKPELDRALESCRGAQQSTLARDAYSLHHFPIVCGVIAYAAAIEEALAHPSQPLPLAARLALAVGLLLFVGGMAVPTWRATRRLLLPRVISTAAAAALVVLLAGAAPSLTLAIAFAATAVVAALEQLRRTAVAAPTPANVV